MEKLEHLQFQRKYIVDFYVETFIIKIEENMGNDFDRAIKKLVKKKVKP